MSAATGRDLRRLPLPANELAESHAQHGSRYRRALPEHADGVAAAAGLE
jgi:hypothetical protein